MAVLARLAGSSGSFVANAFLLLALETVGPLGRFPVCAEPTEPPPKVVTLATPWRAFIDNPGDDPLRSDRQPRCPWPTAVGGGVRLDEAPLPADYDAEAHPDRVMVACVRVDGVGRVTEVRLIHTPPELRRELTTAIRHRWRFTVEESAPEQPGWQRVRLNDGPVEQPVYEPPMLMV